VIPRRELDELRGEWSLAIDVIEKDYMLGWMLAGIAQHPEIASTWVFKGGTCLRKCYYETYRFSEDLDFTVVDDGPEEPADLQRIFTEVAEWIREESGVELVVDDAAFMRVRAAKGLEDNGHEVALAENGREAVTKYAQWRPDAVLMDITMPEMDGLAALKEIRKIDPAARVAMVTAMGQQAIVMAALKAGAKDFLLKPFQPDRILATLQKLLAA